MECVYVAQNHELSSVAVDNGVIREGEFLVKIGQTGDLEDRARTINGLPSARAEGRDWRYMDFAGWKFVRIYKPARGVAVESAEAIYLKRFTDNRLPIWALHNLSRFFGCRLSGFELFSGGERFVETLHGLFPNSARPLLMAADVRGFVQDEFVRSTAPKILDVKAQQFAAERENRRDKRLQGFAVENERAFLARVKRNMVESGER